MDDHLTGILSNIGVISFVALSAYLLLLTGEISFGQQAFFAVGAYTAGIVTAMWQLPFWLGLGAGAAAGGAAALFVGLPTLRLHGLRILFELFRYQVVRDGEPVGPNGIEGFRNIRYIFEHDVSATQFMLIIYGLLGATLFGFFLLERSRLGAAFRTFRAAAGLVADGDRARGDDAIDAVAELEPPKLIDHNPVTVLVLHCAEERTGRERRQDFRRDAAADEDPSG